MEERQMKRKKIVGTIALLVILGVGMFFGVKWFKVVSFESMVNKASKELSKILVEKLEQIDNVENAECFIISDISYIRSKGWREWNESIEITLGVDDDFDSLNENKQYAYLEQTKENINSIRVEFLNATFPKYLHYFDKWYYLDELYSGETVFTKRDVDIVLKTSKNTYQNSTLKNSYQKNNDEIFLEDFEWNNIIPDTFSSVNTTNSSRHTDSEAWSCAKSIVRENLKSPSTADFCSFTQSQITHLGNGEYMVTGWVDAQNSFGAKIRENFVVTYTATPKGYKDGLVVFE